MPSKNRVIPYREEAHYHVYNRGNDKNEIFQDEKDYLVFRKQVRALIKEVEGISVVSYALMKNHFHLLIYQLDERDIVKFMQRLMTRYSLYYRKKYQVSGHVFGGSYRAVLLPEDADVQRTEEYILNNPLHAGLLSWKHVGKTV